MVSDLGKNIYKIRKQKGLSAKTLADMAGVGSSTISQIENGKRQTLQGDTLTKIATALEVSTSELLGDETTRFETNDIIDILNIMIYANFITLDDKTLTHEEQVLLETSMRMSLDAIRYDRLRQQNKK